jgi:alanine racemase
MEYRLSEIAEIINGKLTGFSNDNSLITNLIYDSRKLVFSENTLFVALVGDRNDGHKYLLELYKKGIRFFLVQQKPNLKKMPKAGFIETDDTLKALQRLARFHRQQFEIPIIGITGSNGKTIVKEWLFQLLNSSFKITRSPKSYNSQLGVPLSVLQLKKEDTLGIFEAGISQKNEMKKLAEMISPQLGIFTNIGDAHNAGFSSIKEKIKEKLRLFKKCKTLIYRSDDTALNHQIKRQFKGKTLNWATDATADWRITSIKRIEKNTTEISAIYKGKKREITIPFSSPTMIENAIHCWVAAIYLKVPIQKIRPAIKKLESVAMRLELITGSNNCLLINDSYNADLSSLKAALNFMEQQGDDRPRTLILSDILESGKTANQLYKKLADLIKVYKIQKVIAVGKHISVLKNHISKKIKISYYPTTENLVSQLDLANFKSELILIKGARIFHFERLVVRLRQKHHQTILEINLSALQNNLDHYRKQLQPATKVMVMVKAAAYGIGSVEIGRLLATRSVDYLAVAYTDEGVALRKAGIKLPILVLNPEETSLEALLAFQLEAEIYSIPQLKRLIELTNLNALSPDRFPIHLNLDTGMSRLGLIPIDFSNLFEILISNPALKIASIFTHLAASEAPHHDKFTKQQITTFQTSYSEISQKIGYQPTRHVLNTSGITRFPQYQMEMVRLGIGLYGFDPAIPVGNAQLETVHTLKASISHIKWIKKGTSIGYGRMGIAQEDCLIATLTIGYADGLLRKAGNGRFSGLLHGIRVSTIGNICMDMCMMDITSVPEASMGDEIIIFGPDLPVTELADSLETIPYEIFTGISERVKRVYYQEVV